MEHYIYISFSKSEKFYSRINNRLVGTEQEYITLSNICYNLSCLLIKQAKNKVLGVIMVVLIIKE